MCFLTVRQQKRHPSLIFDELWLSDFGWQSECCNSGVTQWPIVRLWTKKQSKYKKGYKQIENADEEIVTTSIFLCLCSNCSAGLDCCVEAFLLSWWKSQTSWDVPWQHNRNYFNPCIFVFPHWFLQHLLPTTHSLSSSALDLCPTGPISCPLSEVVCIMQKPTVTVPAASSHIKWILGLLCLQQVTYCCASTFRHAGKAIETR